MPAIRSSVYELTDGGKEFQCRLRHCYARNMIQQKYGNDIELFQCRLRHCYARNVRFAPKLGTAAKFQCRLRHCYARNMATFDFAAFDAAVSMPVAALLCPQFHVLENVVRESRQVSMPVAALLCPQSWAFELVYDIIEDGFNAGCGIAMPAMVAKALKSLKASVSFNAGCGIAMPAITQSQPRLGCIRFQCRLRHCYARNSTFGVCRGLQLKVSMPVAALLCPQ